MNIQWNMEIRTFLYIGHKRKFTLESHLTKSNSHVTHIYRHIPEWGKFSCLSSERSETMKRKRKKCSNFSRQNNSGEQANKKKIVPKTIHQI